MYHVNCDACYASCFEIVKGFIDFSLCMAISLVPLSANLYDNIVHFLPLFCILNGILVLKPKAICGSTSVCKEFGVSLIHKADGEMCSAPYFGVSYSPFMLLNCLRTFLQLYYFSLLLQWPNRYCIIIFFRAACCCFHFKYKGKNSPETFQIFNVLNNLK